MPLRTLVDPTTLPALDRAYVHQRPGTGLGPLDPAPRILLLYGSLRERSFSRLAVEEAARLLQLFGAERRIFDPSTKGVYRVLLDRDRKEHSAALLTAFCQQTTPGAKHAFSRRGSVPSRCGSSAERRRGGGVGPANACPRWSIT